MATEAELQNLIRATVVQDGRARIFRNNVGMTPIVCSTCKPKLCGACRMKFTSPIRYGLSVGSSDLVGLVRISENNSRFIGLEIKTAKGKPTEEQKAWANTINRFGGHCSVVRSPEEAIQAVTDALELKCGPTL